MNTVNTTNTANTTANKKATKEVVETKRIRVRPSIDRITVNQSAINQGAVNQEIDEKIIEEAIDEVVNNFNNDVDGNPGMPRIAYDMYLSMVDVEIAIGRGIGFIINAPLSAVKAVVRILRKGYKNIRIRISGDDNTAEQLQALQEELDGDEETDDSSYDDSSYDIGHIVFHTLRGISLGLAVNFALFGGYAIYKAGDVIITSSDGEHVIENFGRGTKIIGITAMVSGGIEVAHSFLSLGHYLVKITIRGAKKVYSKARESYGTFKTAFDERREERQEKREAKRQSNAQRKAQGKVQSNAQGKARTTSQPRATSQVRTSSQDRSARLRSI